MKPEAEAYINHILHWAATNEMVFKITERDNLFAIAATDGTIGSEYVLNDSDPLTVGRTVLIAIHAIKSGSEFHKEHGLMPGPAPRDFELADEGGTGEVPVDPVREGTDGQAVRITPDEPFAPPQL